jgi:hypothetical protein
MSTILGAVNATLGIRGSSGGVTVTLADNVEFHDEHPLPRHMALIPLEGSNIIPSPIVTRDLVFKLTNTFE